MKLINRKTMAIKVLALAVLFVTTSSFSGSWGGDSYRIYVNNKLVMDQIVYNQTSVKTLSLDQRSPNDEISVFYSHCGKAGNARHIIIKNNDEKVLKTWNFANTTSEKAPMVCKARDIVGLQKGNEKLALFYSSKELPDGKMLASIVVGKDNVSLP
jgi:hypothetical protein